MINAPFLPGGPSLVELKRATGDTKDRQRLGFPPPPAGGLFVFRPSKARFGRMVQGRLSYRRCSQTQEKRLFELPLGPGVVTRWHPLHRSSVGQKQTDSPTTPATLPFRCLTHLSLEWLKDSQPQRKRGGDRGNQYTGGKHSNGIVASETPKPGNSRQYIEERLKREQKRPSRIASNALGAGSMASWSSDVCVRLMRCYALALFYLMSTTQPKRGKPTSEGRED